MKYAVFESGGKQYRVSEGDEILLQKLPGKEGDSFKLDRLLLFVDGDNRLVGHPYLENLSINTKIVSHLKGEKIRVATYKAKSKYRKVKGHRQLLTKLLIEKISGKSITPSPKKSVKPKQSKQ